MRKMNMEEKAGKLAEEYELKYHGCSQATLTAIMEALGIDDDKVIAASHPLAGGVGLTGEGTCGALLAAIMAVGLVYGRSRKEMKDGKELCSYSQIPGIEACSLAKAIHDKFKEKMGSTVCCEIQRRFLGKCYSYWNEEHMKEFERIEGHNVCASITARAARIAVEAIKNPERFMKGSSK